MSTLETLPEDLRGIARFAELTGQRKNEIASLTWADVDGEVARVAVIAVAAAHGARRTEHAEGP